MKDEKTIMSDNLDFQITVAQLKSAPGNIRKKTEWMLKAIRWARGGRSKLIVFPELCTSDYMLGDHWEHDAFIREIEAANEAIREESHGIVVVWGSVRADWDRIGEDGRVRKYNAALIAHNGQWVGNGRLKGWIPKTNLPKYRIFDDARHFYPADKLADEMGITLEELLRPFPVEIYGKSVNLALAVCEDLWEDEYNDKISRIYSSQKPDLLIDISQSPWTADKWRAREGMLKRRVKDANCPILYVNSVGLQNNTKNLVWFDGSSCFINRHGEFIWCAPQHKYGIFDFTPLRISGPKPVQKTGIEEIFQAQVAARREFYSAFPRVVTGLSGGIDSAVDLALNTLALGPKKLLAVNMPTQYNSQTTVSLAIQCAEALGVELKLVPIQALYLQQLEALTKAGYVDPRMLVKENIQARIRGHMLASIAAAEDGVFTCNGNKTEVALNYFTLYGDGAGAAAFLADLWKGQIYELARYINAYAKRELIPQGIIDIVPSAELSPDQNVDEGKGDPIFFPYHDPLLKMFTERRWDPSDVMTLRISGELEKVLNIAPGSIDKYFPTRRGFIDNLEWAWTQYHKEFKRHQLPPVLICSRRAFGFDRRAAIFDSYFTDVYKILRNSYLSAT